VRPPHGHRLDRGSPRVGGPDASTNVQTHQPHRGLPWPWPFRARKHLRAGRTMTPLTVATVAAVAALSLAGLRLVFPKTAGFGAVNPAHQGTHRADGDVDHARPRTQTRQQARIAELLEEPLTADAAVELALLNNRGLQASFFPELGICRIRSGPPPVG